MTTFNSLVKRAKILNEANLYNNTDLQEAVMSEIEDTSSEIKKWFKQKYIPWYNGPIGDSEKNTAPFSWKEGDENWAKDKKDLVVFKSLTQSERDTIHAIAEYLKTMPDDRVAKIPYNQAIETARSPEFNTPSTTSPVWQERVLKYREDIKKLCERTQISHLSNAKKWFNNNFMVYFLKECPEFNARMGIDAEWTTRIETLMHYINSENIADTDYERLLIDNNVDPETLIAEAEHSNSVVTESNIKPLEEGIDYIEFNPLFNYTASSVNKGEYEIFNKMVNNGNYKFIRLISQKSFVNEGEKLLHCVKSDSYQHAENHTLISLWKGKTNTGDPQATIEFDAEGSDLTSATKRMIMALREENEARANVAVKKATPITVDFDEWNTITQCKGKGNLAPTSTRVQEILRKFITLNDLIIINDGEKIGLKQWRNKFYDPSSSKWDQLWVDEIVPAQEAAFEAIRKRIRIIED